MNQKDPKRPSTIETSHFSKYALPAALLVALSSPLITLYESRNLRGEVRRRLTAVEETVKQNQRDESARMKRLADWLNKRLEVVKQVRDKLEKAQPSSSEMRDMISSLREILSTIKSILNFFCSFGSEQNKNDFQTMLDKTTDELERLSESSTASEDEGRRQRLIEIADQTQALLEAILKFCVFVDLSEFSINGSNTEIASAVPNAPDSMTACLLV